jgi:hypothetical protein
VREHGRPTVLTVHVSLPLHGPAAREGRAVLRGAELALERSRVRGVRLVVGDEAKALDNARRAAEDPDAIAYLGEQHSAAVARTQSVLADADLLQLAPLATQHTLGGATLLRLCADDAEIAHDIAGWLVERGARRLVVAHDHDEDYGVPVGELCADGAAARGLDVRLRPVWDVHEPVDYDIEGADAVLYVGMAGSGAVALWQALHEVAPQLWLLGTEGVAQPWLARQLAPGAADRTRFFLGQRGGPALHGAEAMDVVLEALRGGAVDRPAVLAAALARDPHWLARQSGVVAIEGGRLVWDLG